MAETEMAGVLALLAFSGVAATFTTHVYSFKPRRSSIPFLIAAIIFWATTLLGLMYLRATSHWLYTAQVVLSFIGTAFLATLAVVTLVSHWSNDEWVQNNEPE